MIAVTDIKATFPNWPDDVVDQWLIYFANEPGMGWPPPDPLGDHRWGKLLGGRDISWWKEVSWKQEKISCDFKSFTPKARGDIADLVKLGGRKELEKNEQRRFDDAFHYILNNAAFPKAPIVMRKQNGTSIIDGTHRIAAFCALQQMPPASFEKLKLQKAALDQNLWVGKHSKGEVAIGD